MRNVVTFIVLLMLSSCVAYRYKFDDYRMEIVSKNYFPIKEVTIESENVFEVFEAITGKRSRKFSLKTFSPEFFTCMSKSFRLDTGVAYAVKAFPTGESASVAINVMLMPDGRIRYVHYKVKSIKDLLEYDSAQMRMKN